MTEGWPDDMTLWDQLFGLISIQFHRSTVPHVRIRILFFSLLLFHFELDEKIVYIFLLHFRPRRWCPFVGWWSIDLSFVIYVKRWFCLCPSEHVRVALAGWFKEVVGFFVCFSCKLKLKALAKEKACLF